MDRKRRRVSTHDPEGRLKAALRRGVVFAACLVFPIFWAGIALAGELVMFEAKGCPYCARWNAEIGLVYDRTAEGARFPLRRVDLDEARPADLKDLVGIRFAPTFVVMEAGMEIGRIVGYLGEYQFYGLLGKIISRLDDEGG